MEPAYYAKLTSENGKGRGGGGNCTLHLRMVDNVAEDGAAHFRLNMDYCSTIFALAKPSATTIIPFLTLTRKIRGQPQKHELGKN